MDTTSSRLESEYEKVFYEYAREGNKLDEPKLREITNGIYDLPENSINSILESFNQLILIHELLIENEYVTPVISIVAMLSTLKVFKIYEKQITTPRNLPIDEYCRLIEKMITLRAIHTSNSGDLQIYQVDFEEKKKVMLQYIIKFKKMIENKRVTSIADQNDSNNYNSLIYRISKTIKIEKLREINTEDEIQAMIKKIFSDLSESDIETIKKMKTSIKCRDFGSGNNELDKLTNFLTYIENILMKNIKSSKDCYESVDKKYCRNIYDIIDKMFDPICKDNKKVNEQLSKEERNISTYNNELNRLYLNMGDEKPSKITELENKKRICMESKKKIEDNISNTKDKLNQILSSFEQCILFIYLLFIV